ncbi:MAG: family hydrolase [Bacteroidetes bacterium]|nr:family hydrolase [Bacteroidota bacterium]
MGNRTDSLKNKRYLFLDRDGVINVHRPDDYVKSVDEFEFLPQVPEALAILARQFDKIIVVTNQRGIGKGKMNENDLQKIHAFMLERIRKAGGRIDAIYYCTALHDNDPCRKPNGGMALQAKKDFPEINFEQSIMAGDNRSDILFGKALGMATVLIKKEAPDDVSLADFIFPSLIGFASSRENE